MGTIAQKLANVATAKANIASAITNKGGEVPTAFIEYGDAINSIPTPAPPSGTKEVSISQNGTTTEDVAAYASAQISVNVPNTYAAGDEGKVVSNGALVSQTSLTITENNTYDTTTKNSVTVNVSGGGGGGSDLFKSVVRRQSHPHWTVSASDLTDVAIIGDYAFHGCSGLTSITIPDSVTDIGTYAFAFCSGLTSITIPDSVTRFGTFVFSNCNHLESATLPNGITKIPQGTFEHCEALGSFSIPDSVTSIESNAFRYCTSLTSIVIPNAVTSIAGWAFGNSSNLATIDFGTTRSTIPTLSSYNAFNSLPANYQIWVPGELLATWKNTENWINLASHICPYQAIDGGECVSEGNGVSIVGGASGTFDANAAFDIDSEGVTMFSENSTLWIGDSIHAIDNSGFEHDFEGPMYNDGQNNGCWSYLKFCNIPQEEVETWSGYPWGFPTNRISYLSRPE